jgi:hypothetical protein
MTHDPICPQGGGASITTTDGLGDFPCLCNLIAKVREDERDGIQAVRLRTLFNEQGYRDGERDMLAKCIALCDSHITRINNEAASQDYERFANEFYANADGIEFIVGELRALQEKP